MKKLLLTALLLLASFPCLRAQRKVISQAREYIKSGENLDQAANLMRDLLEKDSLNRKNPKIYITWFEAVEKQYESGNEQLYLKQPFDTTLLFQYTKSMFDIICTLDSVVRENPEIKTNPKKREKYAETLDKYRRNLFVAGIHYLREDDFLEAYTYFDTYLASAAEPLFSTYNYEANDKRITDAAFWATTCAYRLGDPQKTFVYSNKAEESADTARRLLVYRYEAVAYRQLTDTAGYIAALKKGFHTDPTYKYNFPRLHDYYTSHNMMDSALCLIDEALRAKPDDRFFLYAKSTTLLNMGKNDECIAVTKHLISLCDTVAPPYFNISTAILNNIVELEENEDCDKEEIKAMYKEALPYMEKYRVLAPREKDKWGPALYRIYLNLNMGRQFEEIDKIVNKQ